VLLVVLVLNLIAAAMVLEFEGGNPEANIASYPDALWWAVTTITTVGYGDRFPMSSPGRAVAVVLMIAGIAMFGVITATIAAYFVEQKAEEDVASRLDQIMERLDRIEAGLRAGESQHALYASTPPRPPSWPTTGLPPWPASPETASTAERATTPGAPLIPGS
jgi:voltage-gated potassium channel